MMQVSVEKISNIERRLTIVVPAKQVEKEYAARINQFKNENIKGFRPGKAPLSYIKKRFGDSAFKEAVSNVIQHALYQALLEQKLKPVNTPRVQPKVTSPEQPLEFIASFEVLPEIEKVNFSLEQVEKYIVDIQPEDVTFVVEQLRKQHTSWNIVDRPAQLKDLVIIDYHPIFEGKTEMTNQAQNFSLELGSKVMIPGFEDGLIGATAQEERTLHLHFPETFHLEEKAGKPVDFVVRVKQVYEANEPVLDESFIQKLGIKSGKEEDMRNQIQQSLEQERTRLVKEKLKEQVFGKLLEQNPIEVPPSLIERESKNIHDEIYKHEQQHHHHQHSEKELETFNAIAKKRIALGLLIPALATQMELKTDNDRLHARIQEIASAYEDPAEVTKWLLSEERKPEVLAQILEDQVLDKLLENIQVIEKPMSYAELKGINR